MNATVYWTSLCGNETDDDAFWSSSISWNTSSPDLTECLQQTVLGWAPCLYLWVISVFYIPILCVKCPTIHRNIRKYSRFNIFKTVNCLLLVLLNLTQLFTIIYYNSSFNSHVLADYLQPCILAGTYMLACFLGLFEFRKGIHTSGVQFVFWGILLIINIVPFRSNLIQNILPQDLNITSEMMILLVVFYCSYALVLIQFICHLFTDYAALDHKICIIKKPSQEVTGKDHIRITCPDTYTPWWQRVTFIWVTGLIIQGYRKSVKEHQLWQLTPNNKSENIIKSVLNIWDNSNTDQSIHEQRCCKSRKIYNLNNQQNKQQHWKSLWVVVLKEFVPYLMMGGLFLIIYDILIFTSPFLLNILITFISQDNAESWRGYLYVAALFAISCLRSICFQWNFHFLKLAGMRMRTALVGMMYRKALRLNNKARSNYSVGEIVNLVSVDTQQIQLGAYLLNFVWFSILSTIVGMYLLWLQLGVSIFAGLGVLIVLALLNVVIVRETKKYQEKRMAFKDQRLQMVNEVLTGIKVFKLYAWETLLRDLILGIRKDELKMLWYSGLYNVLGSVLVRVNHYVVGLACFAVFTLISEENILNANTAFVSIYLLNIIQIAVIAVPDAYGLAAQIYVAIERMNKFLNEEELHQNNMKTEESSQCVVSINNGTFSWTADLPPVLENIDLSIPDGKLIAIVGHVGSGKSSLLSAILGELEVLKGYFAIKGSLAYVPQQAWILNTSLKQNVLLTKDLEDQSYNNVIVSCALNPDLEILPMGDLTEIGEKGINLSGGQKQRVSLARAVYQNSDIYLLDDPLSAVDALVGKHIFDNVIGPNGSLENKTRILVTNALTFLPQTDQIICLTDGKISETGSYKELIARKGAFSEFVNTYATNAAEDAMFHEQEETPQEVTLTENNTVVAFENWERSNSSVKRRHNKLDDDDKVLPHHEIKEKNLTGEELAMDGKIKLAIFMSWIKSFGLISAICSAIWLFMVILSMAATNIWVSEWSNDPLSVNGTQDSLQNNFRLQYYGIFILVLVLCQCGVTLSMAFGFINSSKTLHEGLLSNVVRAPMSFYDTTPLGRLINRLSTDVEILDVIIPITFRNYIGSFQLLAVTIILISYSTPIFLAVFVPLLIIYILIQISYVTTSRQIRRIEFINRSPINSHFSESIAGATSIRAYGKLEVFIAKSDRLVDDNQTAYFAYIVAERWMSVILENIGNIIILFAGIFVVYTRDTISPGAAGLSLSFALQVTISLQFVLVMASELDNYIVSVERMLEYTNCPQEAPDKVEDSTPESTWPSKGHVEFKDYATRYRKELDLVLHNVSFQIRPQEKVGIVGRTGAGKSSITMALFRIIESAAGNILVDGINIGTIGLHNVRSKLTIIPQDPVLFSGTLKINIDPLDLHSDEEIWKALELAHLKPYVQSLASGLQYQCGEGGDNLSHGQRQLVCLARAVLRKSKILILDEATAAVDLETDELIQKTIRSEFKDCTIITIAHRLNTIMDYDRILVLDKGCVVENDSPQNLLKEESSIFYSMAKNAGLVS